MLKTIYSKFQRDGFMGLAHAVRNRIYPKKLVNFEAYRSYFESKAGFEIGGPSGIFSRSGNIPIYPIAKLIDNCNFSADTLWEGKLVEGATFVFDKKKPPGAQYCVEAVDLAPIASQAYDFVLSSHCIEHLANPLKGLTEWIRILKVGGVLVLVLPHKDATFDHRRPVTPFEHLVRDFEEAKDEGDLTHLDEILELHDLSRDPGAGNFQSFQERSRHNRDNRALHHHVFDTELATRTVDHLKLAILEVQPFRPYHIVILAQKLEGNAVADNSRFLERSARRVWSSPFPSDKM